MATKRGSRILGSRSSVPSLTPVNDAADPAAGGTAPPAADVQPYRRTLNAMSPFRVGFVGALGVLVACALAGPWSKPSRSSS